MKFPLVLRSKYEDLREDYTRALTDNRRLSEENYKLRSDLDVALRNDYRDPVTGKFMKGN